MHRIVTGSFPDFAGAARGVSALIAAGFADSRISILAMPAPSKAPAEAPAPTGSVRAGASVLGALGAIVGPGSVWALATPDPGALLMWAPSAGAFAGACLGAAAGALLDRFAHAGLAPASPSQASGRVDTESVTVVVDEARAAAVEAILRQHGAALGLRTREGTRGPAASAQPLRLMPGRP